MRAAVTVVAIAFLAIAGTLLARLPIAVLVAPVPAVVALLVSVALANRTNPLSSRMRVYVLGSALAGVSATIAITYGAYLQQQELRGQLSALSTTTEAALTSIAVDAHRAAEQGGISESFRREVLRRLEELSRSLASPVPTSPAAVTTVPLVDGTLPLRIESAVVDRPQARVGDTVVIRLVATNLSQTTQDLGADPQVARPDDPPASFVHPAAPGFPTTSVSPGQRSELPPISMVVDRVGVYYIYPAAYTDTVSHLEAPSTWYQADWSHPVLVTVER